MTIDERLSKMENAVRGFRIVTSGDGDVLGGFDKLSKMDSIPERITELERSVRNFRLEGQSVSVTGDFDQGFVIG